MGKEKSIEEMMKEDGWRTNGLYWWFEDTGAMSFTDAIFYWKSGQ